MNWALASGGAEWYDPSYSPVLLAIIVLAGAGTTALFLVSVVAYRRRRKAPYRLLTVALGALVARTAVGLGTVFGAVPMIVHHLVGHGIDFGIAVLVLYAVYRTGAERPGADGVHEFDD